MVSSKYDDFWRSNLTEVEALLSAAASGQRAGMDSSSIKHLGQRASWAGSLQIREGHCVAANMAHMNSLANVLTEAGLASRTAPLALRLTMNRDARLSIQQDPPSGEATKESVLNVAQVGASAVARSRADDPSPSAEASCVELHKLLATLPRYRQPNEVPFDNGLYFFFERGETTHGGLPRVTRIGNHPLAQGRLRGRLKDHYATGRDAKNGSVFRRYLGGALLRRDEMASCLAPSPGRGHWEQGEARECDSCAGYENRVTALLEESFSFSCIAIEDRPLRNELEKRLIAACAQCPPCQPSRGWLGRFAYPEAVRTSGLWNAEHIDHALPTLAQMADLRRLARGGPADASLGDTLLIIPCSAGKRAQRRLSIPTQSLVNRLDEPSARLLLDARARARPRAGIREETGLLPALARYSGQPYATPGLVPAVEEAMCAGLHVLIVSGGYGLLWATEPIHDYEAPMQRTHTTWRRAVPDLLRAYVAQHGIRRTFGCFSRTYASVVPNDLTAADWRSVPTLEDLGGGAAMQVVPHEVGRRLAALVTNQLLTGSVASVPWAG